MPRRVDRRSVGVRFDTEPEEEEGDADMRAQFASETEREGRRAAAAGARGLLGFDFGPRRRRKEACCALARGKDGPHGQNREEGISIFFFLFPEFSNGFSKGI